MISFFTEYAECAIIKENTPCNFIFQHNRKQLYFVMCDAKNRKVCLVAKNFSTGSNAKQLSKDIATEFAGRGDEIHMYPLSFSKFMSVYRGDHMEMPKGHLKKCYSIIRKIMNNIHSGKWRISTYSLNNPTEYSNIQLINECNIRNHHNGAENAPLYLDILSIAFV